MKPIKLFLFDLDGTLVTTGGAGLRALGRAFDELFHISGVTERVNPSGKTDPAIFREIIQTFLGRDITPAEMLTVSETYLRYLDEEMKNADRARALTGVNEFLRHLMPRPDIVVALGTGNLERGARIKLMPLGLNDYFRFGGFGSDAEERAEVLKAGHRRAKEAGKGTIENENVFVIGDTHLDVRAARRAGYRAVAVATGTIKESELRKENPDYFMKDMSAGMEFLRELEGLA